MKNKLTIFFYLVLCPFAFTQELVVSQDPQADIVPNVPPQTEGRTGKIWTNNTETTNIQLEASDQDGDPLTFTLVTPPTNGTVTITETQSIGIVSQYVASYTPTTAFTTNDGEQVDTFTFKVNDGNEDSNISTVRIETFNKHEKHNWTNSFHGQVQKTIYDGQGNTYQVGYFNTLTNFSDGTSLNANYTPNISYQDAYIIKLNDSGELQWSKIISGEKNQNLDKILFSVDGNIIAKGSSDDTAIFSDGSELGSNGNNNQDFIVKFNANSGDIIWKVLDDGSDTLGNHFNLHAILSNGDILFFNDYYNSDSHTAVKKLNSSNGDITDVPMNEYISSNEVRTIETDNNDNIYIGSRGHNEEYQNSFLIKYDSDLNILWNISVSDNSADNNNAYVWSLEYDSINNLLYVAGRAEEANINPLGNPVTITNNTNSGNYFAAYNTDGILQFSHGFETDINSSASISNYNALEIFDNKLVVRGYFNGNVDFDITDDVFYTPLTGNNGGQFLSIYDLTNGLNFTGHYYDDYGLFGDRDISYRNDKIKVGATFSYVYNFYDYDMSLWINNAYPNPHTSNSDYGSNAGVTEFLLDGENLPANFAPITQGRTGKIWTNNTETTNIQLEASDQDGDNLTFTIVTPPTNGTVTITETQSIGIVNLLLAIHQQQHLQQMTENKLILLPLK